MLTSAANRGSGWEYIYPQYFASTSCLHKDRFQSAVKYRVGKNDCPPGGSCYLRISTSFTTGGQSFLPTLYQYIIYATNGQSYHNKGSKFQKFSPTAAALVIGAQIKVPKMELTDSNYKLTQTQ